MVTFFYIDCKMKELQLTIKTLEFFPDSILFMTHLSQGTSKG